MQDNQREELSYLSGLFDGEGCIILQRDRRPGTWDNEKNWNPIYTCCVSLGMVHKESVERFIDVLQVGRIYLETHRLNRRPIYRLQIKNREGVKKFLTILTPFLRLKKPQAILAMRFLQETTSVRGKYLSTEQKEKREDFYYQMKKMNMTGKGQQEIHPQRLTEWGDLERDYK